MTKGLLVSLLASLCLNAADLDKFQPCDIDRLEMSYDNEETLSLTLYGFCDEGVNILAYTPNGPVALEEGINVDGYATITVPFYPDTVYAAQAPDETVTATLTATVPSLGEWGLFSLIGLLLGFSMRLNRKCF